MVKPAIAVMGSWLIASVEAQPLLVLGAFVLTLIFGWRAFRVRDFTAEISGLRASIDTHETIKRGDDELIKQLREQLTGAQARANAAEANEAKWKAAHDALKPYSAGPAFERLETVIEGLAVSMDTRHAETIDLIRRLAGERAVTEE
jgi:hypothetical protein